MLLLDIHSPTVPMPVPDFWNQSERTVPEPQEENLEAVAVGAAFPLHEYAVVSRLIFAVGPIGAEKNELYAVRSEGTPRQATNKVFVSTARKLLSFDINKEPYPQEDGLDYDENAGPPRPAVVRALTTIVTRNNGSGKPFPHVIAL